MIEQGSATYPPKYTGRHRSTEQPSPNTSGNTYAGRRRAPETPAISIDLSAFRGEFLEVTGA